MVDFGSGQDEPAQVQAVGGRGSPVTGVDLWIYPSGVGHAAEMLFYTEAEYLLSSISQASHME